MHPQALQDTVYFASAYIFHGIATNRLLCIVLAGALPSSEDLAALERGNAAAKTALKEIKTANQSQREKIGVLAAQALHGM